MRVKFSRLSTRKITQLTFYFASYECYATCTLHSHSKIIPTVKTIHSHEIFIIPCDDVLGIIYKPNNICKVVCSQRVSLNAGQEGSPQHDLLPFPRQNYSTVAAGRAPFATVTTTRCWQWISVGAVCECGCPGANKFCCATC